MLHIIFSYSPLTDIVIERPYNLKDIERWSKEAVHSLPQDFCLNITSSIMAIEFIQMVLGRLRMKDFL